MRCGALIGIALIAMGGMQTMAPAQPSHTAITVADDGSASGSVQLPLGRELEVELGANPTTGYTWRLDADKAAPLLRLKSRRYQSGATAGSAPQYGAGGKDRFVFTAAGTGTAELRFEYRRGQAGEPARTFNLTVTIGP
jgi:predicted secreted protein